jgi:hypothetical protein
MQSVGKRGRALDYAEGLEEMGGGTFKIGIKKTYSCELSDCGTAVALQQAS